MYRSFQVDGEQKRFLEQRQHEHVVFGEQRWTAQRMQGSTWVRTAGYMLLPITKTDKALIS